MLGQWERALTQLNVAGDMDASTLAMVQTYREALQCEVLREQVFAGNRAPLVFGAPQEWIALLLEALRLNGQDQHSHASDIRAKAFEAAPATSGSLGTDSFEWIAAADPRLGPVLEAVVNGKYYWIPFNRIKSIEIEAPEDLRDFVWTPAQFTWANGGQAVGLIPTRYPASHEAADPAVKLSRLTDWQGVGDDTFFGLGQRLLATDTDEYPLMDVRNVELNSPEMEEEQIEAVPDDNG